MDKNVLLYWSGGKDSAMALYELSTNPRFSAFRVTDVLTTLTEGYDRISGHGVRHVLLDRQAECLGLTLHKTYIPQQSSMSEYAKLVLVAYELVEEKAAPFEAEQNARPAKLSDEQFRRLKTVENEVGLTLMAFEGRKRKSPK